MLACLRTWLQWLLADLECGNGPMTAQVLADNLEARLAELERAGH
jgi:hypothetical protein